MAQHSNDTSQPLVPFDVTSVMTYARNRLTDPGTPGTSNEAGPSDAPGTSNAAGNLNVMF